MLKLLLTTTKILAKSSQQNMQYVILFYTSVLNCSSYDHLEYGSGKKSDQPAHEYAIIIKL